MVDLVCLGLLFLGGIGGWRKGFLVGAISLVGVLCAYLASYYGYRPIGTLLGGAFGLEPLISYPLGGSLCFGLVSLVFGIIGFRLRRRRSRNGEGKKSSLSLDRMGGILLGMSQMAAWIVVGVGVLSLAQGLAPKKLPDIANSRVGKISKPLLTKLASMIVARTVDNPNVQNFVDAAMKHPERMARNVKALGGNKKLLELFSNPQWVDSLGKPQAASTATPSALVALSRDKQFVTAATEMGLLPPTKGSLSAREVERALTKKLAPIAKSLYKVSHDRKIKTLLKDPELARLMSDRKFVKLLNNPKFNQLLKICGEHFETKGTAAKNAPPAP